jgi:hypothetical protein
MYAFNWKRAVERYSDELSQIVAELIVMAGLQGVAFVDTLPRRLYFRILSILRPAEYAARRIILMAACKLEWNIKVVEAKAGNKPAESLTSPPRGVRRTGRDERPKRKRRARPSGPRLRPLRSGEGLRQVLSERRRIRRADEGARRGKIPAAFHTIRPTSR